MAKRKKITWKVAGFVIREARPGCFLARIRQPKRGLNESKTFPTREAAEAFCMVLANQVKEHGKAALELPIRARQDALDATRLLKGRTSLIEAARFWAQHHPDTGAVTLAQLGDHWLEELRQQNCRLTTLAERRQKVAKLCLAYGDRFACSITTHDLTSWMDARGFKTVNRDGYRRCYRAMFNHALKNEIITTNPADRIAPPKRDEKMPVHWDAATVGRILDVAEEKFPDLVPVLAVMFFAGLRPGEAAALSWEHVDLVEKIIRVLPETSKVRRSRLVPMQSNLVLWLGNYRKLAGAVAPPPLEYRRQREALMKRAKFADWPRDVTRHTFATFRMADTQDAGKVAAELGHVGGTDILYRHYRGLTTPKEAKAFWALKPSGAAVQLADFAAAG